MKNLRTIFLYITIILSAVLVLISLLSLVHDLSYWYSKVLDFPRLQYLIAALLCLASFVLLIRKWNFFGYFLVLGLLTSIYVQLDRISPYWFGEKTVPDVVQNDVQSQDSAGILLANVLIKNKQTEELLKIIEDSNPDMVLLMEVDQWWIDHLGPLREEFPHIMEYPLDNAYGMALYSKLPLEDTEIKFFQHKDVPSFHAKVLLPSGAHFNFHGVHPVAPVPSDKYPDNVNRKEVALLKTAEIIANSSSPSIVAGDFNDVSWSNTSRMFEDTGNLHNVRIGRGLFNSFDANSKIMRWPLDHYFVTEEFALFTLERLPSFGSDHFPMFAEFVLNKE